MAGVNPIEGPQPPRESGSVSAVSGPLSPETLDPLLQFVRILLEWDRQLRSESEAATDQAA